MIKKLTLSVLLALATLSASAEVVRYQIDPVHSAIEFKIRHFLNKIPGTFSQFEGEILFDKDNPSDSRATATIAVSSVDTRNEKRNAHLRTPDFFNADKYPTITFQSTKWEVRGEHEYVVTGILTMMGVSREVELEVGFLGELETGSKTVSGWEAEAEIDRDQWGLRGGKPAVGSDVEIEITIQAKRI